MIKIKTRWVLNSLIFFLSINLSCSPAPGVQHSMQSSAQAWQAIPGMPDLSGIEWIEGNEFLAVHDSKYPSQRSRPRVSIIKKNKHDDGINWTPLEVAWPETSGPSSDLESIARIPGTRNFLLVESGNDGGRSRRIFFSSLDRANKISILEVVNWPVDIYNVEASAIVLVNRQHYFIYAERADGKSNTEIKWATIQFSPLRFGSFHSARYEAGVKGRRIRPIVSLSADKKGNLYSVAAYDPGNSGPFMSYVSLIGNFGLKNGSVKFTPSGKFGDVIKLDGNKIEGITISEERKPEIFAGTDDENLGASFKKLPH